MKKLIAAALSLTLLAGVGLGVCGATGIAPISASAEETQAEYAGRYTVNLKLMQYGGSGSTSMGNNAFNPSGVLVVNEDKTATLEIDLHAMKYLNQDGYLGKLKRVTKVNTYYVSRDGTQGVPTSYETEDATVLEEYEGVYDAFNTPGSQNADENVVGQWYPKKLSIPVEVEIGTDGSVKAANDGDVLVQVYVPVMESIMEGGGTKFAYVELDNDTLQKVPTPTLNGNSATVSGDVTLNSYIELDESITKDSDVKVVTILPDGTQEETLASDVKTSEGYKLSADVPAKDMTADVTYQIVGGDEKILGEVTTSVAEYAEALINSTDSSITAAQKAFAKAMLNYGGYAQEYFGTNLENLANASLTDAEKSLTSVTNATLSDFVAKKSGSVNGLTYCGSALILEGTTKIVHYFKVSGDVSALTFTINGKAVTAQQNGAYYTVTTEGISAANLDDSYTVTVTNGSSTMTLQYSALSYCESALRKSNKTTLQNVSKALYLYNQAANQL